MIPRTDHPPTTGFRKVVVIDGAMGLDYAQVLREGTAIATVGFENLTAPLLQREAPDCILAPLLRAGVDILDIAERLHGLGYTGLLLAITPPLPNPRLIRAEVKAACPGLSFDLIEVPPART